MEYNNVFNEKYKKIALREEIFIMYKIELLDHYENVLNSIITDISSVADGSIQLIISKELEELVQYHYLMQMEIS